MLVVPINANGTFSTFSKCFDNVKVKRFGACKSGFMTYTYTL